MAFEKQLKILDEVDKVIEESFEVGGNFFNNELMSERFKPGNQIKFNWQPHSPAYARRRIPNPMLVQSSVMQNSIVGKGVVKILKNLIRISYNKQVSYAEFHRVGSGNNPVRNWAQKLPSDKTAISKVIQNYVNKNLPN